MQVTSLHAPPPRRKSSSSRCRPANFLDTSYRFFDDSIDSHISQHDHEVTIVLKERKNNISEVKVLIHRVALLLITEFSKIFIFILNSWFYNPALQCGFYNCSFCNLYYTEKNVLIISIKYEIIEYILVKSNKILVIDYSIFFTIKNV